MRKLSNRLFAVCLVVCLCFALTVNSYAVDTVTVGSDSQITTISNVSNYSAYNSRGSVGERAFNWVKDAVTGLFEHPGTIQKYGQYYLQYKTSSFGNDISSHAKLYPYYYALLPTNVGYYKPTTYQTGFTIAYPTSASVAYNAQQTFSTASDARPYYVKTWTLPSSYTYNNPAYVIAEYTLGDLGGAKLPTNNNWWYSTSRVDLGDMSQNISTSKYANSQTYNFASLGLVQLTTNSISSAGYYYHISSVSSASSSSVNYFTSDPSNSYTSIYTYLISDSDSAQIGGAIKIPDIKPNNGYGDLFTDGGLSPDTPAYLADLPSAVEYEFKAGSGILIDETTGFVGSLQTGNYIFDLITQEQRAYSSVDASGNTYSYSLSDGGSLIYEFTESFVREYYTDPDGVTVNRYFSYYVSDNVRVNYETAQKQESSGFLGTIGGNIGDLISGVGNLIVSVVNGVIKGLNDLLRSASQTLQLMLELPKNFAAVLSEIFDVLPAPVANLITSTISVFCLIALVSFLRG